MKIGRFLVVIVEYALVVLATIYKMPWASNIVTLYMWMVTPFVTVVTAIILILTFCGCMKQKQLDDMKKTFHPGFRMKFFRLMHLAEILLLAAYGWMWTAPMLFILLVCRILITNMMNEALKTAKPCKD